MMESFLLAASVVLPLVIYMAVGRLIRATGTLSEDNFKALNVAIFRLFIPLALFFNVYEAELSEAVEPGFFVFVVTAVFLVFAVLFCVVPMLVKDGRDAATLIQGTYRSNFVLFGMMVASSLCKSDGVALTAALSAVVIPFFNILAVILFEVKRGGKVKPGELIVNIFRNPLVDAGILGCIFSGLHIRIPALIAEPLMTLGDIATPLALVTLGGLLSFESMVSHRRYLVCVAAARLVAIPLIIFAVAAGLGMRGDHLAILLAVFGSPTAVASAPMAQTMGGNGALAGEIVATTTVCSVLTIFLFVFGLSALGFLG